ncbi:MAG: 4Fe-4S ferredoxin [Anaerolineales bacterium]|nr:MAG: 4Fe-4S ferredoxin [Anaerolineales bacterium]
MPRNGWIIVDHHHCKGCGLCVIECPKAAINLDLESLTPHGYHPAKLINGECTGCIVCAIVCPDAAITVYRSATKL